MTPDAMKVVLIELVRGMPVHLVVRIVAATLVAFVSFGSGDKLAYAEQRVDLPPDVNLAPALIWRAVGPALGAPITALAGVPQQPGTLFAGVAGGGVWKTTDFASTWTPVFDAPPAGGVTALAVAASHPNLVYASTESDPTHAVLFRTDDGGVTWSPAGPPLPGRITSIVAGTTSPNDVLVATASGIFRSNDGGQTFARVFDIAGGDIRLTSHPTRPAILFAATESAAGLTATSPGHTLYRSHDGGATWQSADRGLPALVTPRVTIAPDTGRIYVLSAVGDRSQLHQSNDDGETWTVATPGPPARPAGPASIAAGPEGRVTISGDDIWMSRDGGATFVPLSGEGLDDVDRFVWHHPTMSDVFVLAGNAGVVATVNAGATWTSRSTMPAADINRVAADANFPYRLCATQGAQAFCSAQHPGDGNRPLHDWAALPSGPNVAPDPQDGAAVFGGNVTRFDRSTQQLLDVGWGPNAGNGATAAIAFSPDGRTVYAGTRSVWRTTSAALGWNEISHDLAADGASDSTATISALAVSAVDPRTIWAGTSDGRLFVTRDAGTTWTTARKPVADAQTSIRTIESSRFDTRSVYVVVTGGSSPATRPTLFRTRDHGTTWVDITVPDAGAVHAAREDPFRRGLLFAGTDRSVFVSYDDGERWESLKLNLPATPVRDLVIKDADLIAATGGRGVWVLEDMSPLRQLTSDVARADAFLFRPAQTWRVRANAAAGETPSAGRAQLTYLLGSSSDDVSIDLIETATGDVLRRFTSRADREPGQLALPTEAGLHRVTWDLRYAPPGGRADESPGTAVLPGVYQVRLTVDGRSIRQPLTIRMDPRVRVATVDLIAQRDLGRAIDAARANLVRLLAQRAATDAPAPAPDVAPLTAALEELTRLASVVRQQDARPAPRIEAAVEAALARAVAAIENAR